MLFIVGAAIGAAGLALPALIQKTPPPIETLVIPIAMGAIGGAITAGLIIPKAIEVVAGDLEDASLELDQILIV